MDDPTAPDFAMLRAVESLAQMHDRARTRPNAPSPQLDFPIALQSDRLALRLGETKRSAVEALLGTGFSYPVRGWHTYAVQARHRAFLSLFYRDGALLGAEVYVPRAQGPPKIAAAPTGDFRLQPGDVGIGAPIDAVPGFFTPAVGGPARVVYDRAFEARFQGGVAYAMARKGRIERLALYANAASP